MPLTLSSQLAYPNPSSRSQPYAGKRRAYLTPSDLLSRFSPKKIFKYTKGNYAPSNAGLLEFSKDIHSVVSHRVKAFGSRPQSSNLTKPVFYTCLAKRMLEAFCKKYNLKSDDSPTVHSFNAIKTFFYTVNLEPNLPQQSVQTPEEVASSLETNKPDLVLAKDFRQEKEDQGVLYSSGVIGAKGPNQKCDIGSMPFLAYCESPRVGDIKPFHYRDALVHFIENKDSRYIVGLLSKGRRANCVEQDLFQAVQGLGADIKCSSVEILREIKAQNSSKPLACGVLDRVSFFIEKSQSPPAPSPANIHEGPADPDSGSDSPASLSESPRRRYAAKLSADQLSSELIAMGYLFPEDEGDSFRDQMANNGFNVNSFVGEPSQFDLELYLNFCTSK